MKRHWCRLGTLLLFVGCIAAGLVGCGGGSGGRTGSSGDGVVSGVGYILTTSSGPPAAQPNPAMEFKNFYGICWDGNSKPTDNLHYAKNMGFKYVVYWYGMEDSPNLDNMNFFVETPHYTAYDSIFKDYAIRPGQTYTVEKKGNIEKFFAWKSRESFPNNIAPGWYYNDQDYTPQPDFQQQAVIEYFVEHIVTFIKSRERADRGFRFAGVTVDVPLITGDFWSKPQSQGGSNVTLAHWTGSDSALLHDGITHEYATYSDGVAAYYKTLLHRLKTEYPGRPIHFIVEPYNPYEDLAPLVSRPDFMEFMPDLIVQEGHDLAFVDDTRLFASGLITRDMVGCTTPDVHSEKGNRLIAAKAGINGSWFTWFGRFGGSGDMINYNNICDVPRSLQLIRLVANWDNLAGVPLAERSWNGTVYKSSNSYMDGHVVATRNPYNGKLYIVFLDRRGKFRLKAGETVTSVQRVDNFFGEAGDGTSDLTINGDLIQLK